MPKQACGRRFQDFVLDVYAIFHGELIVLGCLKTSVASAAASRSDRISRQESFSYYTPFISTLYTGLHYNSYTYVHPLFLYRTPYIPLTHR